MSNSVAIGLTAALAALLTGFQSLARPSARIAEQSVLKLYVTRQSEDYSMPWQSSRPRRGMGTGFYIGKRRILTNAHIASDVRLLQVQKHGDPKRYPAQVTFAGHDCDLATITVDEPDFFKDLRPMDFARALPHLSDEVNVIGYPLGGVRVSVTRGVVSRIDYSAYSHSGVDQHLVLQVDAAINPGNSGGPILFRDKVVGLAFQGLSWAENIGYGIPLPVIMHFLTDIEDGVYHGYPELGASYLATRNPALRREHRLPPHMTGVVLYNIDPFGSALGLLEAGDVLTAIDGYAIQNDGTIEIDGTTLIFPEVLERKQWGDAIRFDVWRDGRLEDINVPLTNREDPFIFRNDYDKRPPYFIVGGLVFSPLSRGYIRTIADHVAEPNAHQLLYYAQYAKQDKLYEGRDEFVVLIRRLPHPVNTYAANFANGILAKVNGRPISRLEDIRSGLLSPVKGFHVFEFEGMDEALVLDSLATRDSSTEILNSYGVPSPHYFEGESGH